MWFHVYMVIFAVIFALISASLNALAAVLQRRATGQAAASELFRSHLVKRVLKNKLWLSGVVLEVMGFFAQAIALHNGSLALVQPLLITDVVFLLIFLHFGLGVSVGKQGALGVGLLSIGLSCLLVVANPHGGDVIPSVSTWLLAICILGLAILVTALAARRIKSATTRAVLGGFAAGLHFSFTAATTKLVVDQLQYGWLQTLFSWQLLALIIVGISSVLTLQSMYAAGSLVITQPTLEITEALAGIEMGIILFGEQVNTGIGALAIEALSGLVAAIGIVLLARTTTKQRQTGH